MSSLTDAHEDYRAAKAAVIEHRRRQAAAELELHAWLQQRRGIPPHELYDRAGQPKDPAHAAMEAKVSKAVDDTNWCRALVIAAGEVAKGRKFADLIRDRADARRLLGDATKETL